MFVGKAEAYLIVIPSDAPLNGKLLALLETIGLEWKGLSETNTLGYYEHSLITNVKSFITLGPLVLSRDKCQCTECHSVISKRLPKDLISVSN